MLFCPNHLSMDSIPLHRARDVHCTPSAVLPCGECSHMAAHFGDNADTLSYPPPLNIPNEMAKPEQVRDEARATNDPARGGMGGLALAEINGQLAPQGGGGGGGGDYYGHGGGGGGGDYYGGGGRANKRPRVDWDARDRR